MIYLTTFPHCFIFSPLCSQHWRDKVANFVEIRQNDFAYVGDWRTRSQSHRGNDRSCNLLYRVILVNRWIARYVNVDQIGVCINHQVFYSTVRSTLAGLQSWNRRGLVDLSVR